MEGVAMSSKPPLAPKVVQVQVAPSDDFNNTWTLVAVAGSVLLLYAISRIIALQRRVRDLESRPPVDDIVMRGAIRQQVSEMVTDLEKSIRARADVKHFEPVKPALAKPVEVVEVKPLAAKPLEAAAKPKPVEVVAKTKPKVVEIVEKTVETKPLEDVEIVSEVVAEESEEEVVVVSSPPKPKRKAAKKL